MNPRFVVVHGWGMDSSCWDNLMAFFPDAHFLRIDLGFVGSMEILSDVSDIKDPIFITHSLGTMWALKNYHKDMKALISINGFTCFGNYADRRVLSVMQAGIKRNPKRQMSEFWNSGGLPSSNSLNIDRLYEGLEWLKSWNVRCELENLQCPVLSLAGEKDNILPIEKMKKEWENYNFQICKGAGHALPVSNSRWCADRIRDFIHDL